MRRTAGFTLIELMIVVVIIAILASIALPSYQDYVVRGKITEATANLGSLRVNMEQYYQDNRKYDNGSPTCGVAMPTRDIKYFTFTCSTSTASGAGDQQYSILATGNATGGMNGFVYSIDQSNNKTTTIASPVDTNAWGTGDATCWVIRKKSC
jgi:type IV pilus assembly protein PilE